MSPPDGGNYPAASAYSCEADTTTITSLLTSTATHLQIRSEVSSVLSTLLTDVETTSTLSHHLTHKSHAASLQHQLTAAQTALAESRAVIHHESLRRQQLGDAFLVELAKLSLKLNELEGWRADNEGRVQECDALRRRLEEMTDRARALELAVQEAGGHGESQSQAGKGGQGSQQTDPNVADAGAATVPKKEEEEAATAAAGTVDAVGVQDKDEPTTVVGDDEAETENSIPAATAATAAEAAGIVSDATAAISADGGDPMPTAKDDDTAVELERQPIIDDGRDNSAARSADAETETSTAENATPESKTGGNKKKKKVLQPPTAMDETDPVLECVPERALMTIFANLEAHDILSTAQVSVIMYSRVDILFGLGGSGGGGGGGGQEGSGEGKSATSGDDAAVVIDELPTSANTAANADAASSSQPVAAAAAAAASSTASALGSTLAGGLFSPFGRNAKPATAAAVSAAADATSSSSSVPTTTANNAKNDATVANANTSVDTTSTAADTASSGVLTASAQTSTGRGRGPMLTPELANSMAEKLSRDELAVIISMQKAQKASESDLSKLRNERDDLIAELKGVESVKDFLVAKLRDVERAQRLAESEKEKVARQVVSDQEVIAFLDYRVQELEGGAEIAGRAKTRAEQDLQAAQAKATEKTRVLSDMLRFERDQLAASEKEWKATKKVLVKEVKQCRANIASLEAERDGLREQNARLREALLSGGKK